MGALCAPLNKGVRPRGEAPGAGFVQGSAAPVFIFLFSPPLSPFSIISFFKRNIYIIYLNIGTGSSPLYSGVPTEHSPVNHLHGVPTENIFCCKYSVV